jgi:hypothetical protein
MGTSGANVKAAEVHADAKKDKWKWQVEVTKSFRLMFLYK